MAYLAVRTGIGYIEAEYALAVNLANTGCLLSQPPLCQFRQAAALEMKAAGTLGQQSENAALAFSGNVRPCRHCQLCRHSSHFRSALFTSK